MKKIIIYAIVIVACIAFCYIFSSIGIRAEGSGNVNPWAFTIGIVVIAVIMALVHKIAAKQEKQDTHDDSEKEMQK